MLTVAIDSQASLSSTLYADPTAAPVTRDNHDLQSQGGQGKRSSRMSHVQEISQLADAVSSDDDDQDDELADEAAAAKGRKEGSRNWSTAALQVFLHMFNVEHVCPVGRDEWNEVRLLVRKAAEKLIQKAKGNMASIRRTTM